RRVEGIAVRSLAPLAGREVPHQRSDRSLRALLPLLLALLGLDEAAAKAVDRAAAHRGSARGGERQVQRLLLPLPLHLLRPGEGDGAAGLDAVDPNALAL